MTKLVALVWDNELQEADLAVTASGFLDSASGFETAVNISLFTWGRDDTADRQLQGQRFGWWGDSFPAAPDDRIGSKLWTLRRAKITPATLSAVKRFSEDALRWMIDDGIAASVAVEAERWPNDINAIVMKVSITRSQGGRWTGIWEVHLNAL